MVSCLAELRDKAWGNIAFPTELIDMDKVNSVSSANKNSTKP
jgi:hypothetical protein